MLSPILYIISATSNIEMENSHSKISWHILNVSCKQAKSINHSFGLSLTLSLSLSLHHHFPLLSVSVFPCLVFSLLPCLPLSLPLHFSPPLSLLFWSKGPRFRSLSPVCPSLSLSLSLSPVC